MSADRVLITLATAGGAGARRNIDGVAGSLRGLAGAAAAAAGVGGLGSLAATTVKWGLSFNAQVESARLRFGLFTRDVKGLTDAVSKIDASSAFNFGDLSDAAALLGNSGVQNIPKVLQATANAAAASGKGLPALQSISIALAQIQAKGKLSQEEINQLNEAGAPHAQKIIQRAFHLTSKEMANLGSNGLDATKAVQALSDAWSKGAMADIAEKQTRTLGGQWDMLTGNLQKLSGTVLTGLSGQLEHGVLPALNKTATGIQDIFGRKGFSDEQKWRYSREAIRRNLGPIASNIWADIQRQDLPGKLGREFEVGMDRATNAVVSAAPHIVSRFVDAWMNAGPWAKVISGAWIAKKLGITTGIAAALSAATRGGGGLGGGGLGARGSNPGNPVWVAIASGGTGPGGGGGLLAPALIATAAAAAVVIVDRKRADEARKAGVTNTIAATGPFAPVADPGKTQATNIAFGNWILGRLGIHIDPAAVAAPAGPSLAGKMIEQGGSGNPFEIHTTVNIDGEPVARAVTRAVNKKKALK